jgi:hypothetical protein
MADKVLELSSKTRQEQTILDASSATWSRDWPFSLEEQVAQPTGACGPANLSENGGGEGE